MARLSVVGLEFLAYHGCHTHERKTGGVFKVDLLVDYDIESASNSDSIHDAVDYVSLMDIAKSEMDKRCDLIETVAKNTALAVERTYPFIQKVEVIIYKMKVPLKHELSHVSVNYIIDKSIDN